MGFTDCYEEIFRRGCILSSIRREDSPRSLQRTSGRNIAGYYGWNSVDMHVCRGVAIEGFASSHDVYSVHGDAQYGVRGLRLELEAGSQKRWEKYPIAHARSYS